jgi:hypothetical protein
VPCTLVLGWTVMLVRMWAAFWTLPSAELLERQRTVRPPTMGDLWREALVSGAEMAALVLLLWPGWTRLYRTRLLLGAVGTAAWFIASAPLAITSVARVHRFWLFLAAVFLLAVFLATLAAAGVRALRSGPAR